MGVHARAHIYTHKSIYKSGHTCCCFFINGLCVCAHVLYFVFVNFPFALSSALIILNAAPFPPEPTLTTWYIFLHVYFHAHIFYPCIHNC